MGLDIREMLICLGTVAVITAATLFAVGAVAAVSYFAHSANFASLMTSRSGLPPVLPIPSDESRS
jgi:hypothetical protein